MMGLLSFLTSGGKAAENVTEIGKKIIDGVGTWIDERNFTPEEAAKMGQKAMETWVEIQKVTAQESSIRSVTRRVLAWGIMGVFLFLLLLAVALYRVDIEYSKFILSVCMDTELGVLVAGVGFLYFGVQFVRK